MRRGAGLGVSVGEAKSDGESECLGMERVVKRVRVKIGE